MALLLTKEIKGIQKNIFAKKIEEKEITKTFTLYCVIKNVNIIKDNNSVLLLDFLDNSTKELIDRKEYSFTCLNIDNAENAVKQGYIYLKTLQEFKGAQDV